MIDELEYIAVNTAIDNAKRGIESSEAERILIRDFVSVRLVHVLPADSPYLPGTVSIDTIEDIQQYFPKEYGEGIDQQEF